MISFHILVPICIILWEIENKYIIHSIFYLNGNYQVEVVPSLVNELVQSIPYTGEYLVNEDKVWIGVSRANGSKCERCWNFSLQVGSFVEHPTLCGRCFNVIAGIQPAPVIAAVSWDIKWLNPSQRSELQPELVNAPFELWQ